MSFPGLSEDRLVEFARSVELVATKIMEGSHFSRQGGEGIEYHSSQLYTPGEDIRSLDWRRLAKSDRLYVKRFEKREQTAWRILVDTSESMKYREKSDYALRFAGCLLLIARALGDPVSVVGAEDWGFTESFEALSQGRLPPVFSDLSFRGHFRKGDRVIVLSDLFFEPQSFEKFFSELGEVGGTSFFIQTLDPSEINFNFQGVSEFRDLESSQKLTLDAKVTQKLYVEALEELCEDWDRMIESNEGRRLRVDARLDRLEEGVFSLFESL